MRLTGGRVFEASEVLRGALRDRRDERVHLPTVAAFRVALLIRQLEPEYLALQASRAQLLQQLGTEDAARPGFWNVLPENLEEFNRQWTALLAQELEVTCQPIPLASLGDGLSYFSVHELLLLGDLVQDDQ